MSFSNIISINDRSIGKGFPPYIVAELSANHNGSIEKAFKTIMSAKQMGADAIKIQTYTPDTMTIDCDKDHFIVKGGLWNGYKLYDLYKWAQTPFEWQKDIFEYASRIGITCFSTPFDESALDLLEDLNCPAYKIASFEATDLPLIEYVASTKKPMIISTGMATFEEIGEAIESARSGGCSDLIILHCTSGYPVPIEEANILTMQDIASQFNVQVGLSDHTMGIASSVAAISLGASVIEKHFILSRSDKGPDSEFSLEPNELKELTTTAKLTWRSLGSVSYERKPVEEANIVFRRSIIASQDIKKGQSFGPGNVRRIRPGIGISPKYYKELIGKISTRDISKGDPIIFEDLG